VAKKRSRGNGDGDVWPRRNKEGRIISYRGAYFGPDGKRRYVSGQTKNETRNKLRKARSDANEGVVFDAQNLSLSEYLHRWLKDSVKDTVRASTYKRYEEVVRLHIVPALGRIKLKALTPAHVQHFYRERLDSGLSPSTVRKFHNVLHRALRQAVRWGLIPRNATEATEPPKETSEEIRPLSEEEARRLLEAAHGDRLEALYVLALTTGMREGELLGLKWEDIELSNGVLRVKRTLTRNGGKLNFGDPKSKKGSRQIDLSEEASKALQAHLDRQMDEMKRLGDLYVDQGLVFTTRKGTPINPSNLRQRSFVKLLKQAGLRKVRFHDLRHTCATLMLSRNIHPKMVQELLGHANVAITLDRYSHFMPGMGRNMALTMDEIFA
jgi:integrase